MQAAEGSPQQKSYVMPASESGSQSNDSRHLGELTNVKDFYSRDIAATRTTRKPGEDGRFPEPDPCNGKQPLTIKQLREAAQGATQNNTNQNSAKKKKQEPVNVTLPVTQKKKPSLFGGLFQVREPTQVALNQVAAQMIAQHGSISPTKVPNVRLEKMPDHVPKVNSKWDGVPDIVKQKEKKEKESAKKTKKDIFSNNASRSGSSGIGADGRKRLDSRNSSSTSGSFTSRGRSARSNSNSAQHRFYAQSVNSSGDLASQQRAEGGPKSRGASLHSHSESTASVPESVVEAIPEIPYYLRQKIVSSDPVAKSSIQTGLDKTAHRPMLTVQSTSDRSPMRKVDQAPSVEDIPTHSASPLPSPHDIAPATPSPLHPSDDYMFRTKSPNTDQPSRLFATPDDLAASTTPKKKPPPIMTPAFLAGEAQELVLPGERGDSSSSDLPLRTWESGRMHGTTSAFAHPRVQQDLEKRPDSSRARLGLRASMLLRDDHNPWEAMEQQAQGLSSPKTLRTPTSPRTKFSKGFGLFNKEKDRP